MVFLLLPLVLLIGAAVWWLAVRSRKHYVCPSCGTEVMVEQMNASSCNLCGAPLKEIVK